MKAKIINSIRDLRKKERMTQVELAAKSGVSRQSIISIEKGHYVPSLVLALRFAQIFECSIEDIFVLKED